MCMKKTETVKTNKIVYQVESKKLSKLLNSLVGWNYKPAAVETIGLYCIGLY